MASKFKDTFLTNEFVTSVTDAIATGKNITLTQAVGSSTIYTDDQLKNINYSQSQSANKEAVTVINSPYRKQDNNTIVIEINLSNEQVNADFQIASILIYGQYNGNNILVGVARLNTPELFPAYDGKSIVTTSTDVFIAIDKVGTVNIAVSAAGLATADSVQQLRKYVDNDFDATIARLNRDNNFLNSNSFAKAINALGGINGALNTRQATFTDFNDLAANLTKYQGLWHGGYDQIANSPEVGWFIINVIAWSSDANLGYIILHYSDHNAVWFGLAINGKIQWSKSSDNSTVLHNTGNETADGIKTFIKQIIAQAGVKGNLQGNADTATKFNATHKIGGVPFDGGSDINLAGVNLKGTQDTSGKAATAGVADSAAKADKLTTGAKINGTNFDGTTDIQVPASNDGQLVHKTGNETVGGQKTFNDAITVLNTITGFLNGNISGYAEKLRVARAIAGVSFDGTKDIDLPGVNKTGNQDTTGNAATADVLNTRVTTFTDFADVASKMVIYSGNWRNGSSVIANSPVSGMTYMIIEVVPDTGGTAGIIRVAQYGNQFAYYNVVNGGKLGTWHKYAQDETVLHNSGAETVKDVKTFLSQIVASAGVKGNLIGNADTATRLATARQIGGVSFNGTADIVLAGVNAKGNQDTSGNADTATTLKYQALADGVDLNTIKTAGLYGIGAASSVKNTPVSRYFLMEVTTIGTTNMKQVIYDTNSNNVWVRSMYASSTFTAWEMLGLDDDLVHKTGDEIVAGSKAFMDSITTKRDNSMINGGGNNGDIALVKQVGSSGFLAVGSQTLQQTFRIKQSNNPSILPTDTFTDIFTVGINGVVKAGKQQDLVPLDKNVVHNNGSETVAGDKNLTGNTGLNVVTTTKQQDTTITVAGINIHFIETSLGVNVLASGSYNAVADGQWKTIGTMPSNITLPLMPVVMNSSAAGGISGVSLREGFTIFIRFTETGSIDVRYTTFKANDNKQYTSSIVVDNSTNWIK